MSMADGGAIRVMRAQIARRCVDSSRLDVRVSYGTVYVTGIITRLREHPEIDLTQEIECIKSSLRSRPGIHSVIWEAQTRV